MAQGNSEAEKFMKPLEKAIDAGHAELKDCKKELFRFLLNYQAEPHTTTKFSTAHAQLLFNREIKTKLPSQINTGDSQVRASTWK